jgi:hypothetical protein
VVPEYFTWWRVRSGGDKLPDLFLGEGIFCIKKTGWLLHNRELAVGFV